MKKEENYIFLKKKKNLGKKLSLKMTAIQGYLDIIGLFLLFSGDRESSVMEVHELACHPPL